jgi:Domain of unknown function (DUF4352)/Double zinc ribbon
VIPEKIDYFCPRCGAKAPDEQSVFCNRCGSPLMGIPPVQDQKAAARPADAAPPVIKKKGCPSCGAPFVDDISDFCNICGAPLRGSAPVRPAPRTVRENIPPRKENPAPAAPVVAGSGDTIEGPVKKKDWRSLMKIGLIGLVLIIIFMVIAAVISGILPGMNPLPANSSSSEQADQNPITTVPTRHITIAATPARTTAPEEVTTTPVPATTVIATTSTKVPSNASVAGTLNASAEVTTKANRTETPSPAVTISSEPLSIGQTASDGKRKLTVTGITFKDKLSDPVPSYAIGKKYLIVAITLENLQNETAEINTNLMLVKDGGGYIFEPAADVMLENPIFQKTIPGKGKLSGNMLYIVPPEATLLKFQYDFGDQMIATFQLS